MVSIIVPVFNREKELNKCISSLLNQTFKDLEIILVDDGSTDSSPQICDEFSDKYDMVKVFHNNNSGVSESRNFGLKMAKGEYVCFIDSDDYIDENYVNKLYNSIISGNYKVAICDYYEVSEERSIICSLPYKNNKEVISSSTLINDILYGRTTNSFCWGRMWKKDYLTVKFKNISYCEDTVFNVENLSVQKVPIIYVKEPLYYYIKHDNSITSQETPEHLKDILYASTILLDINKININVNKKALRSLAVNYAFFVFLISYKFDGYQYEIVKKMCMELIKKYRVKVLFDINSTIKTKIACLLSIISFRLVSLIYYRNKKEK